MTGSGASGSSSAWGAVDRPQRASAYSRSACWNPPHVPRNGRRVSRAKRMAATAPVVFAYGLAGTHQIAAEGAEVLDDVRTETRRVYPGPMDGEAALGRRT